MREICKSGSEGGARQTNVSFLPLSLRRRFAAEKWVKPEVDPPRVSRYRATARSRRNEAMAREAEGF